MVTAMAVTHSHHSCLSILRNLVAGIVKGSVSRPTLEAVETAPGGPPPRTTEFELDFVGFMARFSDTLASDTAGHVCSHASGANRPVSDLEI